MTKEQKQQLEWMFRGFKLRDFAGKEFITPGDQEQARRNFYVLLPLELKLEFGLTDTD